MTKQDQIDYIMAHFDFEKVRDVMAYLDWRWAMGGDCHRVPTVQELRETLLHLFEIMRESKTLQSGGFYIKDTDGTLRVSFELEWQSGLMAKYEELDKRGRVVV